MKEEFSVSFNFRSFLRNRCRNLSTVSLEYFWKSSKSESGAVSSSEFLLEYAFGCILYCRIDSSTIVRYINNEIRIITGELYGKLGSSYFFGVS